MGKWTVGASPHVREPLFVAESLPDGMVSLHIPSPDPVVVTTETAEHIRLIIGSAIGNSHLRQQR